jgi:hypothetical protein
MTQTKLTKDFNFFGNKNKTSINYRHEIRLQEQTMLEFLLVYRNTINPECPKFSPLLSLATATSYYVKSEFA